MFTIFRVASVACKFNSCFPTAKGQSKTENCEGRIQAEHAALSLLGSSNLSRSNSLISNFPGSLQSAVCSDNFLADQVNIGEEPTHAE